MAVTEFKWNINLEIEVSTVQIVDGPFTEVRELFNLFLEFGEKAFQNNVFDRLLHAHTEGSHTSPIYANGRQFPTPVRMRFNWLHTRRGLSKPGGRLFGLSVYSYIAD